MARGVSGRRTAKAVERESAYRLDKQIAKELGSQVGVVGPRDRLRLGVNEDLREEGDVLQRLEDRPVQFIGEIDFAFGAVVEPQPKNVVLYVANGYDVEELDSLHELNLFERSDRIQRLA